MSHTPPSRRRTQARLAAIVPVVALAAATMTACSTGSDSDAGSASGVKDGKLESLRFINPLPNYPTWKQMATCVKKATEARDVTYSESGPTGTAMDATAMTQLTQQAISNKVGAIITTPVGDGFGSVLKQAQAKNIVTGTIYGPDGDDTGADVNAGPDWNFIGETDIKAVNARPGKHVVGMVAPADTGLGKQWMDGVKNAVSKTDNVTIAGAVYTGDDPAKGLAQVTALLTAHPDITDIVTNMGTTTPGAVAAIKAKNLKGKVFLTAVGIDNGGREALDDGYVNQIFLQDICSLGTSIADGVIDKAEGKEVKPIPVPVGVVGKEDLQSYLDKGWS
ncbi:sugar ABC transporter substrate-binding protein [Aeromicrobium endophyticum]|uniref:Sugar ABC transporter substrate-binding protein n=1 Tax=Aeromicrobium endophyticum TaxID=2292704 RepID=A0A371NYX9_9ACTN|nr:substrate-binding domain-containing protein [Aeromicrobium endophyticum]REK68897.1 sugar ABC transporter substrate-binding protein [Aeromicrobium endophyticum]